MITTDPSQTQGKASLIEIEGEQGTHSSPGRAVVATFWFVSSLVCGASWAFGLLIFLDKFRRSLLNGQSQPVSPFIVVVPRVNAFSNLILPSAFLTAGVIGVGVFTWLRVRSMIRHTGIYSTVLHMLPAPLLGGLIIALGASFLMTPPAARGFTSRESLEGIASSTWGWESWIWYWMPYAAPICVLLAIIAVNVRRMRKRDHGAESSARGICVAGEIVDISGENELDGDQLVLTFIVRYTDATGTARYLAKKGVFSPLLVPVVHQLVLVIYDPEKPAHEKSAIVHFVPADEIARITRASEPISQSSVVAAPSLAITSSSFDLVVGS